MHKYFKQATLVALLLLISLLIIHPVLAADSSTKNVTETIFFGNVKDDDSACGVFTILNTVVDVFSIGVGILAAIGITIVGIKYLTAGGNVAQTEKAKHRMFQIVIGLVAYAVLYVGSQWLMPGGKLDFGKRCATVSSEELAQIRAKEIAAKEAQRKKDEEEEAKRKINNTPSNSSSSTSKNNNSESALHQKWLSAIDDAAKYMKNTHYGSRYKNDPCGNNYWSNYKCAKYTGTCTTYVSIALQTAKLIPKNTYIYTDYGKISGSSAAVKALKNNKNVKILYPNKTIKQLKKEGNIKAGDIVMYYKYHDSNNGDIGHIMIFKGFNKKGEPLFNELGGNGLKTNNLRNDYSWRKVTMIIRVQ